MAQGEVIPEQGSLLDDLNQALHQLELLLQAAVSRADAAVHDPTDALRGLIVTPDEIERLLTQPGLSGLWAGTEVHFDLLTPFTFAGDGSPFANLARTLNLSLVDQYILLITLAPELDRRYERLYAYLQDDVSLRRPTINLAMNCLAYARRAVRIWTRLAPESPLRWQGLIDLVSDSARRTCIFAAAMRVDARTLPIARRRLPDERLRSVIEMVRVPPPRRQCRSMRSAPH